jgi:hypothetical protein
VAVQAEAEVRYRGSLDDRFHAEMIIKVATPLRLDMAAIKLRMRVYARAIAAHVFTCAALKVQPRTAIINEANRAQCVRYDVRHLYLQHTDRGHPRSNAQCQSQNSTDMALVKIYC